MTTKIMYPWVVHDIMTNDIKTDKYSPQESIDLISNFNAIAEKLKSIGEIDVQMVEEYFTDPQSKQSEYLVKIVKAIQEASRQHFRGIHLITDDPVAISLILQGLAYTWALTLNKSAGIYPTKKVSKLCHQYNTSFNSEDFQEKFDQLRYMSLLVFSEFHPVNGKYTISSAPEITDLVSSRVRDIKDSFTIIVSTVDTSSMFFQKYAKKKDGDKNRADMDKLCQSLSVQMNAIREVYGTYISNIISRNFSAVIFLIDIYKDQQKISYLN